MKKEFQIGEVFQCGLVKLKVKEAISNKYNCEECFFDGFCNNSINNKIIGDCIGEFREDGKNIIFIESEE